MMVETLKALGVGFAILAFFGIVGAFLVLLDRFAGGLVFWVVVMIGAIFVAKRVGSAAIEVWRYHNRGGR